MCFLQKYTQLYPANKKYSINVLLTFPLSYENVFFLLFFQLLAVFRTFLLGYVNVRETLLECYIWMLSLHLKHPCFIFKDFFFSYVNVPFCHFGNIMRMLHLNVLSMFKKHFYIKRTFFLVMWTLEEHSILSFWNRHENVISECF